MALTAARATQPDVLLGFAGQQLPTGSWLPDGLSTAAAARGRPPGDVPPVLVGHGHGGRLLASRSTPGQHCWAPPAMAQAVPGEPGGVMTPARARMTASQRREMVLHAALTEFATRGLDGTSTHDIAHQAGISQPYLFRLFPTPKALFLAVVRRCFQQVTHALAAAAAGRAAEDALQAIGSAFAQLFQQRTLPLLQVHAYAARTDPEIRGRHPGRVRGPEGLHRAADRAAPARVHRWLGTGLLIAAAIDLHPADKSPTVSPRTPRCIPP